MDDGMWECGWVWVWVCEWGVWLCGCGCEWACGCVDMWGVRGWGGRHGSTPHNGAPITECGVVSKGGGRREAFTCRVTCAACVRATGTRV